MEFPIQPGRAIRSTQWTRISRLHSSVPLKLEEKTGIESLDANEFQEGVVIDVSAQPTEEEPKPTPKGIEETKQALLGEQTAVGSQLQGEADAVKASPID